MFVMRWFVIEAERLKSNLALSLGQSVMMEKFTHAPFAKELNFLMEAPSTQKLSSSTLIGCWSKITPTPRQGLSTHFFFSAIKETTVADEYTVRFYMDDPYASLLSNLAYPTGLIIST